MEKINIYGVVNKVIGNINPAGDASRDDIRLSNLVEMCELVELLVNDIRDVSKNKDRYEHSMKKSGEYADNFLKNLEL
jgi:hypothetical protein